MAALEKGTGLELKIVDLFKKNGYHVMHDIKMTGKSGAEHQIDVLAQFSAPLHTSTVIIEAKSYEKNIDKDIIMKLIQIQQDLSADRAILATTSDFTPGALKTGEQYNNIELWNGKKLASLIGQIQLLDTRDGTNQISAETVKMINSELSLEDAKSYSQNRVVEKSRGGFLGRGKVKESVIDVKKILYPYYDVDFKAKLSYLEKTGWRKKEKVTTTIQSRTGVDGLTGAIIHVKNDGISYRYSFLTDLNADELLVLYSSSKWKNFAKADLAVTGLSEGKIRKAVNGLVGKGVLEPGGTRPVTYSAVHEYPWDPEIFISLFEKYEVVDSSSEEKIEPKITPASITTAFSQYWDTCEVLSIDLVYYPFYKIEFQREGQTSRTEVIDGITGTRQEYLESLV